MDTELLEFRIEKNIGEILPFRAPNSQNIHVGPKVSGGASPAPPGGNRGNLLAPATVLGNLGETYYGKFYFSGLKKGQGITVANALRRVLLYDIFGIGITKVKLKLNNLDDESKDRKQNLLHKTIHEFSTISGMRESVLEFLMHLRSIIWTKPFESLSTFSGKLILKDVVQTFLDSPLTGDKTECFILQAKHLVEKNELFERLENQSSQIDQTTPAVGWGSLPPEGFAHLKVGNTPKIVNPEQYLATFVPIKTNLNSLEFPNLEIEFELQAGNLSTQIDLSTNEFLVESCPFFPIKKVNYTVELEKNSTKQLRQTNSDTECVFFEIWTDGSIHPQKALADGFSILESLFKAGTDFESVS